MKGKFRFLVLALAFVLTLCGVTMLASSSKTAYAAEYSYNENTDGISADSYGNLIVDFTVTDSVNGSMHQWVVYLFSEDAQANFGYNSSTHKYNNSVSMGRNTADYYFMTGVNTSSGHVTVSIAPDAQAYHGGPQDASSITDYQNYAVANTTFADVMDEDDNWYVSVGPYWQSPWANGGYGGPTYNVDYYVSRADDIRTILAAVDRPAINFYDYDGTLLSSEAYTASTTNVPTSGVSFTADSNKTWEGWYCDANNTTYNNLSAVGELLVDDLSKSAKTINFYAKYARNTSEYIEFTPAVNPTVFNYDQNGDETNETILLEENVVNTTITVTYPITHNDGVNSILLLPMYNSDVFTITGAVVDTTTALGAPTITYEGYDKILLESETKYAGLSTTFLTLTFVMDHPADGDYLFGLKLAPYIHNEMSEAYYWVEGGDQNELEVRVVNGSNIVKVITIKDAELEIGSNDTLEEQDSYEFIYGRAPVTVVKEELDSDAANLKVEYYHLGNGDATINWYNASPEGEKIGESLQGVPSLAGTYMVEVVLPASGVYRAATEERLVRIAPKEIIVTLDNKSKGYGEPVANLTYTVSGLIEGDSIKITPSCSVNASSMPGEYAITANYSNLDPAVGAYFVTIEDAVYTVSKMAITLTALNQSATYTGYEPTVDQTKYTVTGTENELLATVVITKVAGVNAGNYDLIPSLSGAGASYYDVDAVNGIFTINSVGEDLDYIKSFFSNKTSEFNGEEQSLYVMDNNTPAWIANADISCVQYRNVGEHDVAVTVLLDSTTANNYTSGVTEFVFTVENSEITALSITIVADSKSSTYGNTPAELTYTMTGDVVYGSNVVVSYAVMNGQNEITLSSSTDAGVYSIVPSAQITLGNYADNENYNITYTNGVYTVNKASTSLTVVAENISYNRDLDVTVTVSYGGGEPVELSDGYTLVIKDSNENVVSGVLNAGNYIAYASIADSANYFGSSDDDAFAVSKIALKAPSVSYSSDTATWTPVTTDSGDVALYNSTLTYSINGVAQEGSSYTATSTAALVLTVSSSNSNYLDAVVNLEAVLTVEFEDNASSHPLNTDTPAGIPSGVQYRFYGETATQPAQNPTLSGYSFGSWKLSGSDYAYDFATLLEENITLYANWVINRYSVTLKYTDTSATANVDMFVASNAVDYKGKVNLNSVLAVLVANGQITTAEDFAPAKASDEAGVSYVFNNTWLNGNVYSINQNGNLEYNGVEYIVTGDVVFVAQYNKVYGVFHLTYYVSTNGGEYEKGQTVDVTYDTTISYASLSTQVQWFRADAWYRNEARTQVAPSVMPADNLDVYGAIVLNIGQGDVNGNGQVNADDITLYRQWIVGGYTMTEVAPNAEYATATSQDFNPENRYFLRSVADNNSDLSLDIRDISVTRMAIVGGYTWAIEGGFNVSGGEIVRNSSANSVEAIVSLAEAGTTVRLYADITEANSDLAISTPKSVSIDLGGRTLTVKSFSIISDSRSTISVKNGTIVTTDGVTISAPNGNVILTGLTAYDENGLINLAAASNSLHFNGVVEFKKGTTQESEPAAVNVEKGTHVVIEQAAEIEVAKLVVTENFVPTLDVSAVISLDILSAEVEEVEVEGNVVDNSEIDTYAKLLEAVANGGSYKLTADINCSSDIYFRKDLTLNLNGYDIVFPRWGIEVTDGAKLTINDSTNSGSISAVENCLLVTDGSELVVNGGTFASTDNFIVGTHGSDGRGGNTITINGGVFNGSITSAGYVACGVYVANNDEIKILGGTFNITNGVGILARSGNTTVANGVVFNVTGDGHLGKVGDSPVTVPAGEKLVIDYAANYPGGVPTLVNNSEYEIYALVDDLNSLIAVWNKAYTIVLAGDMAYNGTFSFTKDTILNLNGHTIRSGNSNALSATQGATLTIKGNGNVIAQEMCVVAFYGSTVIINGGTYTAIDNAVFGTNGTVKQNDDMGHNTITINDGTFNGGITTAGYVACGVYVANSDTVTINGGTFNITNGVGVLARSGNTTIGEDVVFNVTGDGHLGKVGDSQVTVPAGQVLVLDLVANYPGGTPILTNNSNYKIVTISNDIRNINNLADLKTFRDEVNAGNNFAGKTIMLNANITLDGEWTAISNYSRKDSANESKWFAGTFDGNNHTISGLTNNSANISNPNSEFTFGLFGSVKNAVIKNLNLTNVSINAGAGDSLGALVGYYAGSTQKSEANISNITVSGTIAGADNVGGLVGRASGTYFKALNVTVSGTVTALKKASGVIGTGNAQEMVFENCINNANISSTDLDSNQGYNTVAGISITWNGDPKSIVCRKVVLTNCANYGSFYTVNGNSLVGSLAVDYSPKTDMNANGTWTYANGHWTLSAE